MSARRSDLSITVVAVCLLDGLTYCITVVTVLSARRSDLSITVVAVCLLDALT